MDAEAAVEDDIPAVDENPLGDLAEWIRLNRRAEATPAPTPTPVAAAPEVPGAPENPIGTLLPSVTTLQVVGLPTLVVGILATVLIVLITGAVRAYGSNRRAR
ncbi:MAG: hypothetical protein ABUL47_05320 [Leifsonia sp.]